LKTKLSEIFVALLFLAPILAYSADEPPNFIGIYAKTLQVDSDLSDAFNLLEQEGSGLDEICYELGVLKTDLQRMAQLISISQGSLPVELLTINEEIRPKRYLLPSFCGIKAAQPKIGEIPRGNRMALHSYLIEIGSRVRRALTIAHELAWPQG
jgi:hypothetical protein